MASLPTHPPATFFDARSGRLSGSSNHLPSLSVPDLAHKLPFPRIATATGGGSIFEVGSGRVSGFNRLGSPWISNHAAKRPFPRTPTAAVGVNLLTAERSANGEEYDRTIESPRVSEKLDEWMRNSVTEIVKNIREAPLLVQIYDNGEVKTEKAVAEEWPEVRSSSPEGIILVEELREKGDPADELEEDDGTKAFGVVIQGKSKGRDECKSACYLLKTSRVNGGGGMGLFCTHFCLMKVTSFRKSASSHFNDCWLLQ